MANPQVIVDFLANTRALTTAVGQVEGTGGKVKRWAGGVGGAIAGAFAVGAVVKFGSGAIKAAEESEVATSRLDQVFKSMGDTTGTAASESAAYASQLGKTIGVEDELIMAAQAQLATFGDVSDETARGAGIFDRATTAAADLAAAGFGTLDSNSVQLGKALQDPVKGLGSLAKAGVTFSDAQKDQIAAMVESGEKTEAQRMVLEAIEHQVKGTAAATATESAKMSVAFGEVSEQVGTALMPAVSSLATILSETLAPALSGVITFITENIQWLGPLAAGIIAVVAAIKIWTVIQRVFNITLASNPIGLIITLIGVLVTVVALIIANWDKIVATLKAAWAWMRAAATKVFNAIGSVISKVWNSIKRVALAVWNAIKSFISGVWDKIKDSVGDAINWVKDKIATVFKAVKTVVTTIWNGIKTFFVGYWTVLKTIFGTPIEWIQDKVGDVFDAVRDTIKTVWNGIKSFFVTVWTNIKKPFKTAWTYFESFQTFLEGIGEAVADAWETVTSTVTVVWDNVVDGLKSAANVFIDGINWVIGAINNGVDLINKLPGANISHIPKIPRLAQGGVLTRPTVFVGGEAGREIVTPERLMRHIVREEAGGARGGSTYTLNMFPRRADPQDVAWGFRRLELARTGR